MLTELVCLIFFFQDLLAVNVSYHFENETVILPCEQLSNNSIIWNGPPNFFTYAIGKDINQKLPKPDRFVIVHTNGTPQYNLKIRYFSIDDRGIYKCVQRDPDNKVLEIYFNLEMTKAPRNLTIKNEGSNNTVYGYLNKPLSLTCNVIEGIPKGKLVWITNNETVKEAAVSSLVFYFLPTQKDHLKQFTCATRSNTTGHILQHTVRLFVYMPPDVWISPNHKLVILKEGDDLSIYCNYSSELEITELKWDRLVQMNSQLENIQSSSTLSIRNIKRKHGGQYVCTVSNMAGTDSDSVTIEVHYPPKIEVSFVGNKTDRKLRCIPDGIPNVYIFKEWEHRSEYLELIRSLPNSETGTINLPFIKGETDRHQDRGIYICKASNNVSIKDELFTAGELLLQPDGKPYFVTSNNETQYGLLGHMSSITVDFVSFPKLTNFSITPDITNSNSSYTFENVTVLDTLYNKSVNVNGRRLTIPVKVENKTFFQPYTVKLSNQNGSSNFTFILSSASKPITPEIVNIVPKKRQVMLRWRAGFNGGFSQTFFIEYRRRDEEKWKVIHIKDHNQNTYSIDGLTPETEYLIRLFSRNIKGDSGLSDAIPFITDATHENDNLGFILLIVPLLIAVAVLYWQYKKGKLRALERLSCCKWQPFIDAGGIGAVENNFYENQNNEVHNAAAQNMDMPVYNSIERRAHLSIGQCVSYSATPKRKPNPLGKRKNDIAFVGASSGFAKTAESKCTDELNYIDVCFEPKPSGHKFQIHGSDNKTDYVDIDFSKRICSFAESERNSDDDFSSIDDIRMMKKEQNGNLQK